MEFSKSQKCQRADKQPDFWDNPETKKRLAALRRIREFWSYVLQKEIERKPIWHLA